MNSYKTAICKFFPECPRGDTCTFAHGPTELVRTRTQIIQRTIEEYQWRINHTITQLDDPTIDSHKQFQLERLIETLKQHQLSWIRKL